MTMSYYSVPITIPKKAISYDWSDIYFLAESEQDPFSDAKIVTAKNEYQSIIHLQALDIVFDKYPNWGYTNNKRAENFLRKTERELLKKCSGTIKESISYTEDGTIKIVVDVDDVNTDEAVERALNLFSMYRSDGGREEYGKPIKFKPSDFDFSQFEEDEYVC